MRKSLLVGISGRIGKALLDALLNDIRYRGITVLTRHDGRRLKNIHLKVVKADFSNLENHKEEFEGIDDVFCLLGTDFINTANISDASLFDYEYPLNLARVAKNAGVKNFVLLNHSKSSTTTNHDKWSKRGKLENEIRKLGFENLYTFKVNKITKSIDTKSGLYAFSSFISGILNVITIGNLYKLKATPANILAQKMLTITTSNSKDKHEFCPKDY
ncbi:MAG: NAD(P)H-binding protein [Bacteroidia bacterium]|nr:NAD(P)H-binding protein [Bacteroidia bacterium]